MYRLLLFFLIFTTPLLAQRNTFAFGFQAGNNSSRTLIFNEFEGSALKGDFFIGSQFGLVGRGKLFRYKWNWGGFSQSFDVYAEFGVNMAYGGYNYLFEKQTTFQQQFTYAAPLLLIIKPVYHKYWYKSFKKKQIYPIIKSGFSLTKTTAENFQTAYTFGETTLLENIQSSGKVKLYFVGAMGLQREYKNGRVIYIGFSYHFPLSSPTKGTIQVNSTAFNEIAQLSKGSAIWSIDLQYFIGKRTRRPNRKNKNGKLPKIIYNPRYF